MKVTDQAAVDGATAGRLKLAGQSYTLPRWTLQDQNVMRRRLAAIWWTAFAKAAQLPPLPSEAEMDAIEAADPV